MVTLGNNDPWLTPVKTLGGDMRSARHYTSFSAGLGAFPLPSAGLALVKGVKEANLRDDAYSMGISMTMLDQSPVLTGQLIDALTVLLTSR
jgi:hypothetical protein